MPRSTAERKMQQAIVQHARAEKLLVIGSGNGAYLGGKGTGPRSRRQGAVQWTTLKSTGASAGYPDLFIHKRGFFGEIGLAVECKVVGNHLSEAQEGWRADLLTANCGYAVVHSLAEFKAAVSKYLDGTGTNVPGTPTLPIEL